MKKKVTLNTKFIIILLLIGFLVYPAIGFSSKKELTVLLPTINGWIKESDSEYYDRDNLYDYINGGAEIYLKANFQELIVQRYKKNHKELMVDIYRMKEPVDAEKLYSKDCSGKTVNLGNHGTYSIGYLRFWYANYLVIIMSVGENTNIEASILKFGSKIYQNLMSFHMSDS